MLLFIIASVTALVPFIDSAVNDAVSIVTFVKEALVPETFAPLRFLNVPFVRDRLRIDTLFIDAVSNDPSLPLKIEANVLFNFQKFVEMFCKHPLKLCMDALIVEFVVFAWYRFENSTKLLICACTSDERLPMYDSVRDSMLFTRDTFKVLMPLKTLVWFCDVTLTMEQFCTETLPIEAFVTDAFTMDAVVHTSNVLLTFVSDAFVAERFNSEAVVIDALLNDTFSACCVFVTYVFVNDAVVALRLPKEAVVLERKVLPTALKQAFDADNCTTDTV